MNVSAASRSDGTGIVFSVLNKSHKEYGGPMSGCMTGVRSCYDEGKRTAETLTMDYHRGAGVEVC